MKLKKRKSIKELENEATVNILYYSSILLILIILSIFIFRYGITNLHFFSKLIISLFISEGMIDVTIFILFFIPKINKFYKYKIDNVDKIEDTSFTNIIILLIISISTFVLSFLFINIFQINIIFKLLFSFGIKEEIEAIILKYSKSMSDAYENIFYKYLTHYK